VATRPREGFPRSRRIRRRADFLRVQGDRRAGSRPLPHPSLPHPSLPHPSVPAAKVSCRHFLLLFAPTTGEGPTRLGVVASRKMGGAVQRNRAKRLLREAFRRTVATLPEGLDLVVVVRSGADELGLGEVVEELRKAAPQLARRAAQLRGR
jgi:ribonuclease P protein component